MTIAIIIGMTLIILFSVMSSKAKEAAKKVKKEEDERKKSKEISEAIIKVEIAKTNGIIYLAQYETLINNLKTTGDWRLIIDHKIDEFRKAKEKEERLITKYGNEIAEKILHQRFWVGMTPEQLIESKGTPDKIEKQILKTKTKELYIYGNKSSGDVFVIEEGEVVKITDR